MPLRDHLSSTIVLNKPHILKAICKGFSGFVFKSPFKHQLDSRRGTKRNVVSIYHHQKNPEKILATNILISLTQQITLQPEQRFEKILSILNLYIHSLCLWYSGCDVIQSGKQMRKSAVQTSRDIREITLLKYSTSCVSNKLYTPPLPPILGIVHV